MPIIAGRASAAYGAGFGLVLGAVSVADAGSMVPLSAFTLSSAQASVEFTNIPQDYQHLQIRMLSRSTRAVVGTNLIFRFNSDTGPNYSWHYLAGDGASPSSGGQAPASLPYILKCTGASAGANTFGVGVWDILDYTNTNKHKVSRALSGYDNNGSGEVSLFSASWRNTAAITSITIDDVITTDNIAAGTSFALYGIKGA